MSFYNKIRVFLVCLLCIVILFQKYVIAIADENNGENEHSVRSFMAIVSGTDIYTTRTITLLRFYDSELFVFSLPEILEFRDEQGELIHYRALVVGDIVEVKVQSIIEFLDEPAHEYGAAGEEPVPGASTNDGDADSDAVDATVSAESYADFVVVREPAVLDGTVLSISRSNDGRERRVEGNIIVDGADSVITIGEEDFVFTSDIIITIDGVETAIDHIQPESRIFMRFYNSTIWFIDILQGDSTVRVINAGHIMNGFLRSLNDDFTPIPIGASVDESEQWALIFAGTHHIKIVGDNIADREFMFQVQSGEVEEIDVGTIEAIAGFLTLNISEADATVLLDGREFENWHDPIMLEFGKHTIRVLADGFERYEVEFVHEYDGYVLYIELLRLVQEQVVDGRLVLERIFIALGIVLGIGFVVALPAGLISKVKKNRAEERAKKVKADNDKLAISASGLSTKRNIGSLRSAKATFNAEKGEILYVLGGSGTGKTVLLKILGGYDKRYGGVLQFAEVNAEKEDRTVKEIVGYVPQIDSLYNELTPCQLLKGYYKIFVKSKDRFSGRVENLLKSLDLSTVMDSKISKLSGGQRKRLSIGVELLRDPEVLLLDEPDSGLDEANRDKLHELLLDINKANRITIVLSTHFDNKNINKISVADEQSGGIIENPVGRFGSVNIWGAIDKYRKPSSKPSSNASEMPHPMSPKQ